ncbi:neuropeptide S [Elgaria multicarinata webbii]|uniref:neuropeptide S n=1 Tax=Elgaria multicarinata webbii TaxID=159646 RepID=UPI002FCD3BA7
MTSEKDKECGYTEFLLTAESFIKQKKKMISLFRLNVLLLLWVSAMQMWRCHPIVPSTLSRKSDYCLLLLNSCLPQVDGSEELALLKPFLEKPHMKRSFRNGVGSGTKKTSFRRA